MPNVHAFASSNAIEAALLGRTRPQAGPVAGHEQAMARRLAQLQTALGNDLPPTAPAAAPERSSGLTSSLIFGLGAALLAAVVIWLTLSPSDDTRQTVLQPALATTAPTPALIESSPAPQPQATASAQEVDKARIEALLESWRQAWQAKDIAAYLEAYGAAFRPVDGSSRETWVSTRTKKLSTRAAIEVLLSDITLERIEDNLFRVSFLQSYASGNYRESNRSKTLLIVRENDDWKIISEQQD